MAATGLDPINVHVGDRLRLVRRSHGMVQRELAAVLDVSFQQLQKYERGVNRIGPGPLYRLACFLDVPVEFFFQGVSEEIVRSLPQRPAEQPAGEPGLRTKESQGRAALADMAAVSTLRTDRAARRLLSAFSRVEDQRLRNAIVDFVHSVERSVTN